MIFSSKKKRRGDLFSQIEELSRRDEVARDPELARRVLELRHRAGIELVENPIPRPTEYPAPAAHAPRGESGVPEVGPEEVTPELLRAAIMESGCLLIRGLIDPEEAARLVEGIDRAYEAREAHTAGTDSDGAYYDPFVTDPRYDIAPERVYVRTGAGLWAADSPRVMVEVLEAFERAGLRDLATRYLGERSAISVNKCLLRRVRPQLLSDVFGSGGAKTSAWHQDGAFLGDVRALNVWLSLSRCGDVAPGLDLVPRRLDHIVPVGTEGAAFDWSVSHDVAEEAAGEAGIVRPIFEPGDALLFDDMFLHATAAEPEMPNMRYAVESWFFGASAFPAKYAPLAF